MVKTNKYAQLLVISMNRIRRPRSIPNFTSFLVFTFLVGTLFSTNAFAQFLPYSKEWPNTEFDNRVVELSEIKSGGVPKDGIPAIDKPEFISVDFASNWLNTNEPVIVLDILGQARAYPLQILIWHEIVNETFNNRHVAVTFCPLCNASIVFDRNLDGTILDFGTTGRLRHSDLVMYDRQTESWWQQITGNGIVGIYAGVKLAQLPSQITSFGEFANAYPHGEVLSRDTGFSRKYGLNPYRGYDDINNNPFFIDQTDPRLPAMERVLNVSVNNRHRVYPFSVFKEETVINDKFNGVPLVIFSKNDAASALDQANISQSRIIPSAAAFRRDVNDQVLTFEQRDGAYYDLESGSKWNLFGHAIEGPLAGLQLKDIASGLHFAFAWLVFHPDSDIYQAN